MAELTKETEEGLHELMQYIDCNIARWYVSINMITSIILSLQLFADNSQYGVCEIRSIIKQRYFEKFIRDVLSRTASYERNAFKILLASLYQRYTARHWYYKVRVIFSPNYCQSLPKLF